MDVDTILAMDLTYWDILGRLLLAMGFAAIIGLDREFAGKAAGLRTMMLVGLGSAAFTLLGTASVSESVQAIDGLGEKASIHFDTSRVIAGIVGGIGFLGAGTIIHARGQIHGVTTAAGIWVTAAIGVGSGLGEYAIVIITGLCAIFTIGLLRFVTPQQPQEKVPDDDDSDDGDDTEQPEAPPVHTP